MATDDDQPTAPPQRPSIPPPLVTRPYTAAEAARMRRLAERGQRAEEAVAKLPHDVEDTSPQRPVIDVDADEHNANWLRILAKRRNERQNKETPDNG